MDEKKIYLRRIFKILKKMTVYDLKKIYCYVIKYYNNHYI